MYDTIINKAVFVSLEIKELNSTIKDLNVYMYQRKPGSLWALNYRRQDT